MGFLSPKVPKEDPAAKARREAAERRAESERLDETQDELLRRTRFKSRLFGARAEGAGGGAGAFSGSTGLGVGGLGGLGGLAGFGGLRGFAGLR